MSDGPHSDTLEILMAQVSLIQHGCPRTPAVRPASRAPLESAIYAPEPVKPTRSVHGAGARASTVALTTNWCGAEKSD